VQVPELQRSVAAAADGALRRKVGTEARDAAGVPDEVAVRLREPGRHGTGSQRRCALVDRDDLVVGLPVEVHFDPAGASVDGAGVALPLFRPRRD
jgi:hypothetical protein